MKQTEAQVQAAIIEALTMDGWLILRINQGGRQDGRRKCQHCPGSLSAVCPICGKVNKPRYTRFAYYQALGIEATDKGIADVIAVKDIKVSIQWPGPNHYIFPRFLAIEVKATGKKAKLQAALDEGLGEDGPAFQKLSEREKGQARFLFAVREHGGIAVVADCLEDVAPYLDRIHVE